MSSTRLIEEVRPFGTHSIQSRRQKFRVVDQIVRDNFAETLENLRVRKHVERLPAPSSRGTKAKQGRRKLSVHGVNFLCRTS